MPEHTHTHTVTRSTGATACGVPHCLYHCYTTCRLVPEICCKMVTRRHCYTVPEVKTCNIPYTTCRWEKEQHVRYVVRRPLPN